MLLRYFDLSNLFNFMQLLPPAWIEKTYYYTNDFDLKSKITAVPFRNLPVRIGSAYSNRLTLSREQSC